MSHVNPRLVENEYVSVKQCRHGLFAYNINDLYIGRSLDTYGEWAEAEVSLLLQLVEPGGVVVDAGANIGTHTIALAKRVTASGGVFAIEPQPLLFQFLCANAALNALINVRCHNAAAGDAPGVLRIPVLDPSQPFNFGCFQAQGHVDGEPIDVIRIDDLALPRCDLIKIDTEGMEAAVLRGARQTIAEYRPALFVENNSEAHSPGVLALLDDLGYKCWWHIARTYNPHNFFANGEDLFPRGVPEANILCVPKNVSLNGGDLWPVEGLEDTFMKVMTRHGHQFTIE
jgi:FkbM family methyltransferase